MTIADILNAPLLTQKELFKDMTPDQRFLYHQVTECSNFTRNEFMLRLWVEYWNNKSQGVWMEQEMAA